MTERTVVLVHGAWHSGSHWDRVAAGLRARGRAVVAVDLPGPPSDLHGDAAHVRTVLDGIDGPVVLVGHSYGGAVVTEAAAHPAVAHVVFVAAFMLEDGESAAAAAPGTPIDHTGRPDFGAAIRPDGTFDPDRAVEAFYADCDPDAAAAAIAALRPQNLANLGQSPAVIGWRGKPTTYAVCTDDLAVHPDLQRVLAQRAGTVVEWATGHSPFLSRPDLVVDLLAAL